MRITPAISIELTPDIIDQILVTAFDGNYGGCLYWCSVMEIRDFQPAHGLSDDTLWAEAEIIEHGERVRHVITAAKIGKGLIRFIEEGLIRPQCLGDLVQDEATDLDATDCDSIIQFGVFGEVRYG